MQRSHVFFILFILGTLLPALCAGFWIMENNATPFDFFQAIFSSWLSISLFLGIVVCAFSTLAAFHNRISGKRLAAVAIAITFFGPSSGLPLYFYYKETGTAS